MSVRLRMGRVAAVKLGRALLAAAAATISAAAIAGPPYLTDDPVPTDPGHWEIYAPLIEAEGRGSEFDGTVSAEFNYGAAPDLQLTVALPAAYSHDARGWHWGRGDAELGAKYRFFHDDQAGVSAAVFPSFTLPTASDGLGNSKVTALLPVWLEKDAGRWSIFGGGGYAINPGRGNRNYWTSGIAVTRQLGKTLQLGVEATHDGSSAVGEGASTSLGVGAIVKLNDTFRLLMSGGPTFVARDGPAHFHCFAALGIDL